MITELLLLGEILNKKVIYTPLHYNNFLGASWSPFFSFFYPTCIYVLQVHGLLGGRGFPDMHSFVLQKLFAFDPFMEF